jgi:uncharacterized protein (DUF1697 family)
MDGGGALKAPKCLQEMYMETYIAILRGINVSGQKLIPMQALKALFEELNFQQVSTYIQSGNVLFRAEPADAQVLAAQIENSILERFQCQVPVLIRTAADLQAAIGRNPFLQQNNPDTDKMHVTFLADHPTQARIGQLSNGQYEPDQYHISGREVFLYCPQGYGRTKLNNTFFETKLGVRATTRNLKTVRQLISLAEAGG